MDLRRADREVVVLDGHRLGDQVGERAGQLDARRAAADDDEVQRALADQRRVAVRGLEHLEDARAQAGGVVERVERERVLLGAGRVEEVRLRADRQHERVAGELLAARQLDAVGRRVDGGHLAELDLDARVVAEQLAQRERDVDRGELRRRHLVEQRLELVVVVAVDERHADAVLARQPLDAADAGEAAADHDDVQAGQATCSASGRRVRDAHAVEQVVADAQGVGHRGERGVHRPDAREAARVDDVEVVDLVRAAVRVEHGLRRVGAEAAGPGLVRAARDRDLVLEVGVARDQVVVVHARAGRGAT